MKRPDLPQEFKIIGLTGPSGAGKGEVGMRVQRLGIPVIDTDAVYHEILRPPSLCLEELLRTFGKSILAPDGTLDRGALAALVFDKDDDARRRHQRLNEITHRYVIERSFALLEHYAMDGASAAVIDAPLLIESGLDQICDGVIVVLADREVRLDRLLARDQKDKAAIITRLDAQPQDDFYLARADAVIYNGGEVSLLDGALLDALARMGVSVCE